MKFRPLRTAAPAVTPISVAEVKARLHVDHAEDDATLAGYIAAATAYLDGWSGILGRCLISQAWKLRLACIPADRIVVLPFPDCTAVALSVSISGAAPVPLDSDGISPVMEMDTGSAVRLFSDLHIPAISERGYFEATFTAGFGPLAADVPDALRQALHLMVADQYRFTETAVMGSSSSVPSSAQVEYLIAPYRRVSL